MSNNNTNTTEQPTVQPTGIITDSPTGGPTEFITDGPTQGPTPGPTFNEVTPNPTNSPTGGPDVNVIHLPSFKKDEPVNLVFIVIPTLLLIVVFILGCQRRRRGSHVLHSN